MKQIADWPKIFGHIITSTGWSRAEVEALTLRDANELLSYWSEHLPAHLLLASLLPRSRGGKRVAEKDLASAVAALGGSVGCTPSRDLKTLLESQSS